MKYYIYISDAKVDMLYPQVPHSIKKKVATEFGVDFKVLKATRKAEVESEENRITKLEAVLSFIREYGNLGSVDEPNDYFEDTLRMSFQIIHGMMYLSGRTELTALGLAGSSQSLIGRASSEPDWSPQLAYNIVTTLREIEEEMDLGRNSEEETDHRGLQYVADLAKHLKDCEQFEFFAKRLLYDPDFKDQSDKSQRVLLGSPLYVAKAD